MLRGGCVVCTKVELNTVIKEVTKAALKLYNSVDKIFLYGSYARGDNTAESDIDILIVLDCLQADIKKHKKLFSEVASDIGLEHDVLLSVLFRTKDDFEDGLSYRPFYKNVVKEGIEIYDRAA